MFFWVVLQHSFVAAYITQSELAELNPDVAESFTESDHFCGNYWDEISLDAPFEPIDAVFRRVETSV